MLRTTALIVLVLLNYNTILSQVLDSLSKEDIDSIYIYEVQDKYAKDKVLHAEPLYIDLIRDLGARKGEREWNIGFGLASFNSHDAYEALVEYEWAPIDRLGLEIEVPVSFYYPVVGADTLPIPESRIESLKLAGQWSFFVNERVATSLALGYIHEFEFSSFKSFGKPLFYAQLYNPFFIAAKRWGNNFHTLLYTGPRVQQEFGHNELKLGFEAHTNLHYMISGTRNFIGLEVNKYVHDNEVEITLRPQLRLAIADNFMIGIVPGVPLGSRDERLSMFLRVIWEPRDHHER